MLLQGRLDPRSKASLLSPSEQQPRLPETLRRSSGPENRKQTSQVGPGQLLSAASMGGSRDFAKTGLRSELCQGILHYAGAPQCPAPTLQPDVRGGSYS